MEKAVVSKKLYNCELQFKLALAVATTCHTSDARALHYLGTFSYGKHVMDAKELSLTAEEERVASVILEHSATFLMALQLDEILEKLIPNRFEHDDNSIRNGSRIIRLIRNAYAHDPLSPMWLKIPASWKNQVFKVDNVISLNTNGLEGKRLKRMDYGGPISLLRLLQYFKQVINKEISDNQ
jgi:hypothetical protein